MINLLPLLLSRSVLIPLATSALAAGLTFKASSLYYENKLEALQVKSQGDLAAKDKEYTGKLNTLNEQIQQKTQALQSLSASLARDRFKKEAVVKDRLATVLQPFLSAPPLSTLNPTCLSGNTVTLSAINQAIDIVEAKK